MDRRLRRLTDRPQERTFKPVSSAGPLPPALDPEDFRSLGHAAVDLLADTLAGLSAGPVFQPLSPDRRDVLREAALPAEGLAPEAILARFREEVLPFPMGNGHPRFFGWVNSPPAPLGIVAELLAAGMNPSCAGGDHAAVYLEHAVLRWLEELVGFPVEGAGGLLVSGGSMASLTALAAARHRAALQDGWNVRRDGLAGRPELCLYVSQEGHGCLRKAAELLGLGGGVRSVATDASFRMDLEALARAVDEDRRAGRRPFAVAASAGTVNTGAIDPLADLADFCAERGLWLHVDGAYGAVGILDPRVAPHYAGLERVDSLALDPHKALCVPVECGCVLVRDAELLRDAFRLVPAYLRTEEGKGFGGPPWFSEYGFQQSRGFRALKLWMTLLHLGRAGARRLVEHQHGLARTLAARIEATDDLELRAPTTLSVVCFRHLGRPGDDEPRRDALNRLIMERLQSEGRVFLTGAELRGRFALRACTLHYGTRPADVEALVAEVRAAAARCA